MFSQELFSSSVAVIAVQICCILISFFIPELLYRLTKKQEGWHVLLASFLMIISVSALTATHGATLKSITNLSSQTAPAPTPPPTQEAPQAAESTTTPEAEGPSSQTSAPSASAPLPETLDISFTTKLSTVALPVNTPTNIDVQLTNHGDSGVFNCKVSVQNPQGKSIAPLNTYTVTAFAESVTLDTDQSDHCSWSLLFTKAGQYVIETSATGPGAAAGVQQVAVDVTGENTARAQSGQGTIWVFSSREEGNDELLAQQLREHGYPTAEAQGHWETRSEEQYIFYRNKQNLRDIMEKTSVEDLQAYKFSGERISGRIKDIFNENSDVDFVVIVH